MCIDVSSKTCFFLGERFDCYFCGINYYLVLGSTVAHSQSDKTATQCFPFHKLNLHFNIKVFFNSHFSKYLFKSKRDLSL